MIKFPEGYLELLGVLTLLAIFLERSLAFIFEIPLVKPHFELIFRRTPPPSPEPGRSPAAKRDLLLGDVLGGGLKATIALVSAWWLCHHLPFDIFGPLSTPPPKLAHATDLQALLTLLFGHRPVPVEPSGVHTFLTGLVVAGGSAGAIKLFQDVLGFSKRGRDAGRDTGVANAELGLQQAAAKLAPGAKAQECDARPGVSDSGVWAPGSAQSPTVPSPAGAP